MMFLVVVLLIATLGSTVYAHLAAKNMWRVARLLQEHKQVIDALLQQQARIIGVLAAASGFAAKEARGEEYCRSVSELLAELEGHFGVVVQYGEPDPT
jgi:hypothetical protein